MVNERIIYCYKCNVYVGTIRDAKLMKGLSFICATCVKKEKQDTTLNIPKSNDAFNNLFTESIFNDIFKKDKMCD
jgi:hypothetical protein